MLIPAIITGAVVSAVSVVGLTTLSTADPADPAGPDDLRIPCGAIWDRLPQDLRTDIEALKDLPAEERPAAVEAIRADVVAGEYGAEAAAAAKRLQDRRADVFAQLPQDLQDDIEAVRGLPAAERAAAAKGVRDDALGGEYGDRIQAFAERRQERRETCRN